MKSRSRRFSRVMTAILFGTLAGVFWSGCASTYQAREAEPSGFLGDYSQLQAGKTNEALMVYVNPKVVFKSYDKIMMEPVRIYAAKDSALGKLPPEDLKRLVDYLDATLREQLKENYTFVTAPGLGVMQVRVAITDAHGAKVFLDTFSTLMPIGLAISEIKKLSTGTHTAVGAVSIEVEGLDSVSQIRLFAAVDRRVGQKMTGKFDKFQKWRTANDSFDYWAERMKTRLAEERAKEIAK